MNRFAIAASIGSICLQVFSPSAHADPPAVFDAIIAGHRVSIELEELLERAPLADGEAFHVAELGRDEHTSHHIVSIRNREVPHRHDRHDLMVVMLRGSGAMLQGTDERPIGPGSILYIPRGTPHAYRNAGTEPAIAYAVYTPPFDGKDRVVTEPKP